MGLDTPEPAFRNAGKGFPGLHQNLNSKLLCYPSPLDKIRSGQNERRTQFGLDSAMGDSFECNQSFPKCSKVKLNIPSRKVNLDNFKGDFLERYVAFSRFILKRSEIESFLSTKLCLKHFLLNKW